MALDATVAGAAADSYLTVVAAAALAGSDMGPEADKWLAGTTTDAEREKALKRATREIDGYVRTGWLKHTSTQALTFPREIDEVSSSPVIPTAITQATYHQAAYILKNATIIDGADARHARALSQYTEPNISGSVDDDGINIISPRALHYLAGFRVAAGGRGGSMRSLRMSSGFPGT